MLKRHFRVVRKSARNLISTDQPGRYVAVFIISPILAKKGYEYKDIFIQLFSLLLFTWDLFWLIMYPAKKTNTKTNIT